MRHVLVASLLVLGTGCAVEPSDPTSKEEGLSLVEQTPTHIAGSFVRGDVELRFDLAVMTEKVYRFSYSAGDVTVVADLDYARGEGNIVSSGIMTADVAKAFEELHFSIGDILPDDRDPFTDAIARNTSLMSVAPVGVQVPEHTFVSERGWTYISCSCFNQNIGNGYTRQAGKGANCTGGGGPCKGRCGTGCSGVENGWNSAGHGAYTQQCAQHDYGLTSWVNASDDYSFAGWNC